MKLNVALMNKLTLRSKGQRKSAAIPAGREIESRYFLSL